MKHVVIVDDNDTQLVLLELLLNQMGIKPVSFLNPLKAYEYIKANRIDLLISDFNMPDINGIELIHEVKKLFPDLQTAIVSAIRDTDGGLKQECDYLNSPLLLKPFDLKGFKEFIDGLINIDPKKINCIKNKDQTCLLRDKVASTYCMNCCLDDIAEEKEVIQNAVDALDDFYPSELMLRHVSTKLSFVAHTINTTNNPDLKELLHIVQQLACILHEYSEQILNSEDITMLVSSYLNGIRDWFEFTFLSKTIGSQASNYNDSIRADFQSIEMALGISIINEDIYDDLDDLFF